MALDPSYQETFIWVEFEFCNGWGCSTTTDFKYMTFRSADAPAAAPANQAVDGSGAFYFEMTWDAVSDADGYMVYVPDNYRINIDDGSEVYDPVTLSTGFQFNYYGANSTAIMPEWTDGDNNLVFSWDDVALTSWKGEYYDLQDDNVATRAFEETIAIMVCAHKFGVMVCPNAGVDVVIKEPENPPAPENISTELTANDLLLWIDWDDPTTDTSCTITEYKVYIVDSNGDSVEETTFCVGELITENNICVMPSSEATDTFGLASGDNVVALVEAWCDTLESPLPSPPEGTWTALP